MVFRWLGAYRLAGSILDFFANRVEIQIHWGALWCSLHGGFCPKNSVKVLFDDKRWDFTDNAILLHLKDRAWIPLTPMPYEILCSGRCKPFLPTCELSPRGKYAVIKNSVTLETLNGIIILDHGINTCNKCVVNFITKGESNKAYISKEFKKRILMIYTLSESIIWRRWLRLWERQWVSSSNLSMLVLWARLKRPG